MSFRTCTKCNLSLSIDLFVKRYDGRISYVCRKCRNTQNRNYNHSPQGQHARHTHQKRPKRQFALKLADIARRKTIGRRITEARYKQSEKGKALQRRAQAKFRKSLKGKARKARAHAKRKLLAPRINNLTASQWEQILDNFLHACAYCGRSDCKMTQDHIHPLAKGGQHTAENIAPACQSCNSRKQDFLPAGF